MERVIPVGAAPLLAKLDVKKGAANHHVSFSASPELADVAAQLVGCHPHLLVSSVEQLLRVAAPLVQAFAPVLMQESAQNEPLVVALRFGAEEQEETLTLIMTERMQARIRGTIGTVGTSARAHFAGQSAQGTVPVLPEVARKAAVEIAVHRAVAEKLVSEAVDVLVAAAQRSDGEALRQQAVELQGKAVEHQEKVAAAFALVGCPDGFGVGMIRGAGP